MKTIDLQSDEVLVLRAIHLESKRTECSFIYFEEIQKHILGFTQSQISECVKNLKGKNVLHYFANLDECTQIHIL